MAKAIQLSNICLKQLIVLVSLGIVGSFNIEEKYPLIKHGPTGSFFGLSVAEHHFVSDASDTSHAVMLIGAPRAKRSSFHSSDSVQPGSLYKCKLSVQSDDCESVFLDGTPNTMQTNNSNQWLGVSVSSQKPGGKVAVCAHRYRFIGGSIAHGIIWEAEVGRCYVLKSDLSLTDSLFQQAPCIGRLSPNGAYNPEYYGYCQAGISVSFADNREEDLIIGIPGIFSWMGGFKLTEFHEDILFPFSEWSHSKPNDGALDHSSYIGFSTATASDSIGILHIVCGAPRANGTGAVVIYKKLSMDVTRLSLQNIIYGERFTSAFGYSVAFSDITGDGQQDLIVGAPQYYDREKEIGGAVYIYVNKGAGHFEPDPTYVLYGDTESAFGTSITNVGDINMDGSNDLAIGAPGAGNGIGNVYIYHGDGDSEYGIRTQPVQVISGKALTTTNGLNIMGFGYSLSGGLDMDFNGYPDFMVGSLSDIAFLYRIRPIVNVSAKLTASSDHVNIDPKTNPEAVLFTDSISGTSYKLVTFKISVCLNYTSLSSAFDEPVDVNYTINLDFERIFHGLRPRALFNPLDVKSAMKTDTLKLYRQSMRQSRCITMVVYLDNAMQDKLSPFVISVSYDILNKSISMNPSRIKLPSLNPILNLKPANFTSTQVNISKNCGPDDVCKSALQMKAEYVILFESSSEWKSLQKDDGGLPLFLIGTEKAIGLKINVSNLNPGEAAHQAKLHIVLPEFLQYDSLTEIHAIAATIKCNIPEANASVVSCDLGNPFLTDSSLSTIIQLRNDAELYKISHFSVLLEVTTSSMQDLHGIYDYAASVKVQSQLHVSGYTVNDQMPFSGKSIAESDVKIPSDAGSYVDHTYEVRNTGNAEVTDAYVNISWPQAFKDGKWMFYLLSIEIATPSGVSYQSCDLPDNFNPLQLSYVNQPSTAAIPRKKREMKNLSMQRSAVNQPQSKILACPKTAECLNLTCSLGTIPSQGKSYIHLIAIAWNSSFLEEYQDVAEIRVFSSASICLNHPNAVFTKFSELQAVVSTSMLAEVSLKSKQQVSYWMIVVAVLVGVFLLFAISLILRKCGFFKRKKKNEYKRAKKQHVQELPVKSETQERLLK